MVAVVRSASRVVFCGDSNTATLKWYRPGLDTTFDAANLELSTGYVKSVNAALATPRPSRGASNAGRAAASAGRAGVGESSVGAAIVEINTGVNGTAIGDLVANFTTRVTAQNPDLVIPFVGLVNVGPPLVRGTTGAFVAGSPSGDVSALGALLAGLPAALGKPVSVIWPSIFCNAAQWGAGPAWANDPANDASIVTIDGLIQAECTARGFTYVDQRTPLLAYLAAHNTPAPGAPDYLTYDAIHLRPFAQDLMGGYVYAQTTVVP